jgi:ABC-type amino acid transport system permease subunit
LAAIDAAMNNAIVARVEQWAKDNQIHLGKEQMQTSTAVSAITLPPLAQRLQGSVTK